MRIFAPADYAKELNGQAFKDSQLGEFIINAIATGDEVAEKERCSSRPSKDNS